MKKEHTYLPYIKYMLLLLLCNIFTINAQVKKQFTPRFSETVNGNATIIANNMLSRSATGNYTGSAGNHDFSDNVFVDIDSDNSTFNSSSANFTNPIPSASCLVIKKAYLYWAAADLEESDPDDEPNWNYNQVKLMYPGSSSYITVSADEVIYRGRDEHFVNDPYICFKDITTEVQNLSSPYGSYQLANVKAKEGGLTSHGGGNTGTSGGWEVVFIYENPTLPSKNITIFDGYAHVTSSVNSFEIEFNGFQTVPTGDVNTTIVLGSLEGDRDLSGDKLQIQNVANNWVDLSTPLRDSNNFFNSKILKDGAEFLDRNPASTNTLGFDADVFQLDNPSNTIIDNNQTSAKIRLTSNQETYGLFLLGLAVDVWEPDLDPLVLQTSIPSGSSVNAGDVIDFSVDIQNNGNDDVRNLVIETTLPEELDFESADSLPAGVTYTYDISTRLLKFFIDDGMADIGSPSFTIQFKLKVKDRCFFLETKCASTFQIQLMATYNGVQSPKEVFLYSSSGVDACGIGNLQPNDILINQPALVNWLTAPNALDSTISCDNQQALDDAQNLVPELEDCNLTIQKTSGAFIPSGSCNGNGTYTNTWEYTDICGRTSSTYTQIITVQDTSNPTFVESLPADTTVECDNIPTAPTLTGSDTCDNDVQVSYNETITGQDDECVVEYTITRTWTATDCANNQFQHIQTINVVDSSAPTFVESLPADITVECDDIPDADVLTVIDNCDSNLTVLLNESTPKRTGCVGAYIILRVWSAEDCAGNSVEYTQTITVEDTTAPTFVEALPTDMTVECDNIPNPTDLSATDNCDNLILVVFDESISGQDDGCATNYTITRKWSVNDCADNSIEHIQTITVEDTTAPTFVEALPSNTTVECASIPDAETLTAIDNCENNINVSFNESITGQDDECAAEYVITRTWSITDCAGNANEHVQVITVEDNSDPSFTGTLPDDATVECDNIPSPAVLTAVDACDNNPIINFNESISGQDDECAIEYTITRTWTVTDCVNNSTGHVQVITVQDTQDPVFDSSSLPQNVTVSCEDSIPAIEDIIISVSDNCADVSDINITPSEVISGQDDGCASEYTITRTWVATDCANNSIEHIQVITVEDTVAPNFVEALPDNLTVECDSIPDANVLTAIDNCDNNISVSFNEDIISDPDGCITNYTINRTWSVSDCAGNTTEHTQVITVEDSSDPVLSGDLPADVTVECDNIPDPAVLTVEDNCGNDIPIGYNEVITNQDDGCAIEYTITRTWTVTDCAGNTTEHIQVITVEDNTNPTFDASSLPQDVTISCDDSIPAIEDIVIIVTDNCADVSDITITPSEVITNQDDECANNYTITRTWTANDCAGNSIEHTQIIIVEDTTSPTFDSSSLPQDITVECDDTIPNLEDIVISVTDNCADVSDITITPSEVITGQDDECANNYIITRTWVASDCAGNTIEHVQVITVEDNTAPEFVEVLPANITVECDSIPDADILTATDNCDTNLNVVFNEEIINDPDGCATNYTINRTWSVADCAGNNIQYTQVITVEDSSDPVLSGDLPTDITVECDNIPEPAVLTVEDNCGNNIPIGYNEVISNQDDGCAIEYTITRTWTVTDCAGNSSEHIQVITVEDTTSPTFDISSLPQDVTVECDENIPALEDILISVTDNCANVDDIVITPSEVITNQDDECANNYIITRTWTANDCAGNSIEHVQVITVQDTTAPSFDTSSLPQNVTVSCDETIPAIEDIVIVVTDNCSDVSDIIITPSEVISGQDDECANNYTITRTWIANDCAGNSIEHVQVITVEDTQDPEFDINSLPQDVTVSCDESIPAIEDIVINVTDNCSDLSDINITPSEVITGQDDECANNYIITRTWIASDCAGNTIEHVQIITVEDTQNPEFDTSSLPQDVTVNCDDSIPAIEDIVINVTDNCADVSDITITPSEVISGQDDGCANNYFITRTWVASDCAGNTIEHVQVISVQDISAPELTLEASDNVIECELYTADDFDDWLASNGDASANDSCSEVVWSSNYTEENWVTICGNSKYIDVLFYAADACGNTVETSARFTIEDTSPPEITNDIEPLITYCNEIPLQVLEAIDNCSSEDPVIEFTETTEGNLGDDDYTIIRDWIITDECGNQTEFQQILLVDEDCDCLEDKLISKVVTPNGDIHNDYFKVEGIDDCGVPTLKIFNRWGNLIYRSSEYDSKKGRWRGEAQGGLTIGTNNKLPTGTYFYIIEIANSDVRPITGHIYLGTK